MNKHQSIAVAIVVALVAGFLVNRGESPVDAAPEAPAPMFDDMGLFAFEPGVDDGLNNFMVIISDRSVAASTADTSPAPVDATTTSSVGDPPETQRLDEPQLDLDQLDPDRGTARIWLDDDGQYWARYEDGSDVALGISEQPAAEVPPVDRFATVDELAMDLATDDRIADLTPVDANTLAVETSYTEAELAARTGGLDIIVDEQVVAFETDPYFAQQWGLENDGSLQGAIADADIDVTKAWASSTGGSGVVIAVLDSGVDFGHPDLASSRWVNSDETCGNGVDDDGNGYIDDCHGWDFIGNDATSWDGSNHFHGTHVAGISSSRVDDVGVAGVAPLSVVMDVRVLDARGSGQTSGIAAGIRYAVDNGADVLNISLGAGPGLPRTAFAPVEAAIAAAHAQGVVVVVAAGNSNVNIDSSPVWPASFAQYYDHVIAVASTDAADGRSSFSNYGVATVGIAAPGSSILSTMPNGRWSTANGTSMAAPMVAGAAALVVGDTPGIAPVDALSELINAADAVPSLAGAVAQSVRLNVGNLYTERSTAPVELLATGLSSAAADRPISAQLTLRVNDGSTFSDDAFVWDARLFTVVDGAVYGVAEHSVTAGARARVTDGAGAFELSEPATLATSPLLTGRGETIGVSTWLPAGTYALIVEAVALDGTVIDATTNTLYFVVEPGQAAVEPGPTTVPAPDATAPPATGPTPSVPSGTPTAPTQTTLAPSVPLPQGPAPTNPTQSTIASSPATVPTDTTVVATIPAGPTPTTPGPATTGPTPTGPTPEVRPPVSTPLAPTTTVGSPGEVAPPDQSWRVDLITPNEGFVTTSGLVTLRGSFPRAATVWFGNSAASTVSSSADTLVVNHPRFGSTGLVDVRLVADSGAVLTMPEAFLFIDAIDQNLTTTTGSASSPGSEPVVTLPPEAEVPDSTPGPAATTTTLPLPTTSTSVAPGRPDAGSGAPTPSNEISTPPTTVERTVPSRFVAGESFDHPNGLRLSPIAAPANPTTLDPAQWPASACSAVVCTAATG